MLLFTIDGSCAECRQVNKNNNISHAVGSSQCINLAFLLYSAQ